MERDYLRTCVHPSGRFIAGVHRPSYEVRNNRLSTHRIALGKTTEGKVVRNDANFPEGDLQIEAADWVYEVPNAFPMWGVTYILGRAAEKNGQDGLKFSFEPKGQTHFSGIPGLEKIDLAMLPRPILLAIAQTCTNDSLLERLLPLCVGLEYDNREERWVIRFHKDKDGNLVPEIKDHDLYETLGNNPFLTDELKRLLLLNPGIQGSNPIVGEYIHKGKTHIWEYLRANSYIPWGHFAANMAQDSIRYSVDELDMEDIKGLRHLYYQRIYCKLAANLNIKLGGKGFFSPNELEDIRLSILQRLDSIRQKGSTPFFTGTLWGWNYGYDFSPSGFRLHASHQQIHQQFALIPGQAEALFEGKEQSPFFSYAIGDNISHFIHHYEKRHGTSFFEAYIQAIKNNTRLDGEKYLPRDLIITGDEDVILFVPKAQRSQGEIQIITLRPCGNILEAGQDIRQSLDSHILAAVKILSRLGAKMITCFEMSKRFNHTSDQRLMYCFLPKHPRSPGAFSEQQGRWITGHFPEDYAQCCRDVLEEIQI